jgi:mRNA interferase RelE/StbE
MAAYRIEFVKSAEKEFARLPGRIRSKVTEALSLLAQNPYSELLNVKKLKGAAEVFRFRIGDYRVLYEVRNKSLVVVVIKIGNRRDVYR